MIALVLWKIEKLNTDAAIIIDQEAISRGMEASRFQSGIFVSSR
jgi:hypothetical protein